MAFPDPDDPTASRELDVMAARDLHISEKFNFVLRAYVLAECKQSRNPYVLIGKSHAQRRTGPPLFEHHFRFPSVIYKKEPIGPDQTRSRAASIVDYLGLADLPGSPYADTFTASQMTRLDRDKQGFTAVNSGIFTSLVYPLAKAVTYQRKTLSNGFNSIQHTLTGPRVSIHLYFPVVVTSAPLYTVNVDEEGYVPCQVPWAAMRRQIRSKTIDGSFRIEVVNQDHLDEWLTTRVRTFTDALAEMAEKDPARFVTPEDLTFTPTERASTTS